jgi:uncharacterized membrane protein
VRAVRQVYRYLVAVLFVAILAQIGFAGYGAFDAIHAAAHHRVTKKTIENGFDIHGLVGAVIVIALILLLIVALAGRLGRPAVRDAGILALLGVIQAVLGGVSTSVPALGFLHALNALAILGVTARLAHRTWAEHRRSSAAAAPA